jgi:hypothetical protein
VRGLAQKKALIEALRIPHEKEYLVSSTGNPYVSTTKDRNYGWGYEQLVPSRDLQ